MDFSSLFGGIGSAISSGINYFSQQATNAQNMLMNTGAWKAQQVSTEARDLGVSPLAVLGNTGSNTPMQAAQVDLGAAGQALGRAASPAVKDDELHDLQVQNQKLVNAKLQNDVVAGNFINSVRAKQLADASRPNPIPLPRERPDEANVTDVTQAAKGNFGVPMLAPMWDPNTQSTVWYPTRDASARSFGSLGEPTSRVLGDIAAGVNLKRKLQSRARDVRDSFSDGPFDVGPLGLRPDIARKYQDRILEGQ